MKKSDFKPRTISAHSDAAKKTVDYEVTLEDDPSNGGKVYVARNGKEELRFSPSMDEKELELALTQNNKRSQE